MSKPHPNFTAYFTYSLKNSSTIYPNTFTKWNEKVWEGNNLADFEEFAIDWIIKHPNHVIHSKTLEEFVGGVKIKTTVL